MGITAGPMVFDARGSTPLNTASGQKKATKKRQPWQKNGRGQKRITQETDYIDS